MKKVNKVLFAVLAMLVVISAASSVIAVDSENGTMDYEPLDDTPVPEDDDDSEDTTGEATAGGDGGSSNGESTTVSLTEHATANPILVLMASLTLIGFAAKRK